jgi:RNA polymerase sigma factor (TIGR02999 family)
MTELRAPEDPLLRPGEITGLLRAVEKGDRESVDRLFTLLYGNLRGVAHGQLRRVPSGQTLDTTALVHETYLKLSEGASWSARDRQHFFALAGRAMRMILIDRARSRSRLRRGAGARPINLDVLEVPVEERASELLDLDEALVRLGAVDQELARLVELRYFAGLSLEKIAKMTGQSVRTLNRSWQSARTFLYKELAASRPGA